MHRSIWRLLAAVSSLALQLLLTASLRAQPAAQAANSDVLPALLVEVRGLRAAMEQMASAGPRVQLAMGRLQLQEQRVNNLMRQLGEVQASLRDIEQQGDGARQEMQRIEQTVLSPKDEQDPHIKEQLQMQAANLKSQLIRTDGDLARLRGEESSVTQQLNLEQGRWSDINKGLEDLERALARK